MTMATEQPMASRNAVELAIAAVEPGCPDDVVAEARVKVMAILRWAGEMRDVLDARIADVIAASGRDVRYTADADGNEIILTTKAEKVVKCRDVRAGLEELLSAFDGDFTELAECLGASAWKHGAVRKALEAHGKPGLFDQLFETTEKTRVVEKTGKPAVREINTRFIK